MIDRLQGVIPPVPTPFDEAGHVHRRALADNVARWMKTDLAGILALGSNGEAALLDDDECDAIVATVRDGVPKTRLVTVVSVDRSRAIPKSITRGPS